MSQKVVIAGVGMIPFTKPGASESFHVMGAQAVRLALSDARIDYRAIEQAFVGYVYGDSTCGQRALYPVGMTGIPIFNVNNNCATGSSALYLARQAVNSGEADCVLALGFEQMQPGAVKTNFPDRDTPFDEFNRETDNVLGPADLPFAIRYFGGAGKAHMEKYGTRLETFANIRAKASRHAVNNPLSMFRKEVSVDEVMNSPVIWPGVMTRLMACPPSCGAAAAVVCSEAYAKKHGLDSRISIAAQVMVTDLNSTFESHDMMRVAGYDMAREAGRKLYEQAGIGPDDLDVIELHDCFAQNELITYEALCLCPEGGAEKFVRDGDNTYGGKIVTNPSGGLLSKGHPLGATGLAQCYELTHQLRGTADKRQVAGARVALQHNLGIGGACVVTLYKAS